MTTYAGVTNCQKQSGFFGPPCIFIFIHHKSSDKNNNNSEEKQNNLTKQRNRVTCKFLNEFFIPLSVTCSKRT